MMAALIPTDIGLWKSPSQKLAQELGEPKAYINPTSNPHKADVGLKSHTLQLDRNIQMIHLQVRTMSRYKSNIPQENKWSANWHVEVYDVQQGRAAAPTIIMSG